MDKLKKLLDEITDLPYTKEHMEEAYQAGKETVYEQLKERKSTILTNYYRLESCVRWRDVQEICEDEKK